MDLPVERRPTNGIELSTVDAGDGPAVVLLHGFPELAYSWRHQIPALVDAGYRVIAPDQRGYGASDRPPDVESYALTELVADVVGLLDTLDDLGIGSIAFTPLAQGMLTNKYLKGIPDGSRATQGKSLKKEFLNEDTLKAIAALHEMAERRGQTLAQMALAWVLRKGRVTSALIGASRAEQVRDCAAVVNNMDFTDAELKKIDATTVEGNVNLWAASSERKGPSR